jgi:hypothetical protein
MSRIKLIITTIRSTISRIAGPGQGFLCLTKDQSKFSQQKERFVFKSPYRSYEPGKTNWKDVNL